MLPHCCPAALECRIAQQASDAGIFARASAASLDTAKPVPPPPGIGASSCSCPPSAPRGALSRRRMLFVEPCSSSVTTKAHRARPTWPSRRRRANHRRRQWVSRQESLELARRAAAAASTRGSDRPAAVPERRPVVGHHGAARSRGTRRARTRRMLFGKVARTSAAVQRPPASSSRSSPTLGPQAATLSPTALPSR